MKSSAGTTLDCAILIPTHKEVLNDLEFASLRNTLRTLEKWHAYVLLPNGLGCEFYLDLQKSYKNLRVINLESGFLGSIENYNSMALSPKFYSRFKDYSYLLICHLDSWVFRDELDKWIELGYDYIGAPLFLPENGLSRNIWNLAAPVGGNGGLCLRRTSKMLQLCSNFKLRPNYWLFLRGVFFLLQNRRTDLLRIYIFICKSILLNVGAFQKKYNVYEDVMISVLFALLDRSLRVAPPKVAARFALEVNMEEILSTQLRLNLPFGVHGIGKYISQDCMDSLISKQSALQTNKSISRQMPVLCADQAPVVTVITIIKDIVKGGRVEMLKQCIDSVQRQTYPNLEHLIIDGASGDGTLEILDEYKDLPSIKIHSSPDNGIWDAMDKGVSLASGDFVNIMNSDDYFCDENAVQIAMNSIRESCADWFYSGATVVRQDGSRYAFPTSLYGVFSCMGIVHQTVFVKRELLAASAAFSSRYKTKENYLMMMLIMNGFRPAYYPEPLVHYREGGYSSQEYGGNRLEQTKQDFADYFYILAGRRWGLSKADCNEMFGWQIFGTRGLRYSLALGLKLRPIKLKIDFYKRLLSYAWHHRGLKSIFYGAFRSIF